MNITLNPALTRYYADARGNRQVIYFTLTDDNGVSYRMVDDIDAGIDAASYLSVNMERQCVFVRRAEYRQMPPINHVSGQTQLQAIEKWIADGCRIITGHDDDHNPVYGVASKSEWKQRWTDAEITRQQAILNSLPSWVQIDAAITNIANLADAKAFIRKLARVVYWLAKNTEA